MAPIYHKHNARFLFCWTGPLWISCFLCVCWTGAIGLRFSCTHFLRRDACTCRAPAGTGTTSPAALFLRSFRFTACRRITAQHAGHFSLGLRSFRRHHRLTSFLSSFFCDLWFHPLFLFDFFRFVSPRHHSFLLPFSHRYLFFLCFYCISTSTCIFRGTLLFCTWHFHVPAPLHFSHSLFVISCVGFHLYLHSVCCACFSALHFISVSTLR